jgi:catechol 1,2-dioxygenase
MENTRLDAIVTDVLESLDRVIAEHRVTEDEWRLFVAWLTEAGTQPNEIPLLLDVHFAAAVDDVNNTGGGGTENTVEGPFYVPGAPMLTAPYVLPMRPDEPGERLVFSGTVRSTGGTPLGGAMLDVWQVSPEGGYSHFHPGYPDYNLRGRLTTDGEGRFELLTVVPTPYEIPKGGATGRLLTAMGRTAYRPAHLHLKVTCEGHRPLTTQVYFEGDPWLGRDAVLGTDKPALVARLVRDGGGGPARCTFDLVLERAPAAVPA